VSTRINILDQANNFDGTNKIMSGDCPATMTLKDCEATYSKALDDYKNPAKPPRLHPAGVALYRSDSFVSDVAAARMNKGAVDGKCKDRGYTVRQLADCIRKKMP
jgi:hypothetical protein